MIERFERAHSWKWVRSPNFHSRADRLAVVVHGIGCLARCSIGFILFSAWFYGATAIAGPETAYSHEGPVQPIHATRGEDAQEGSHPTGEAADPQAPQTPVAQQGEAKTEPTQADKGAAKSSEKKGEWLLAPIPISSPAIGSGLEWAVARVFPLNKKDEVSPASAVGVAGIFTNNGSRGVAIGGKLYMKEDKYRVAVGIANASVNFDVYGIGENAGRQGVYIPLNVDGRAGIGEFLYRLRKGIYVGARGQYRNAILSLNQDRLESSDITSEPPDKVANVIGQIQNQLLQQTAL